MEPIRNILTGSKLAYKQVESLQVCALWAKIVAKVDEKYLAESKAEKFSHGVLTIIVCSSTGMMELKMQEMRLLEEYRSKFKADVVRELRFKLA